MINTESVPVKKVKITDYFAKRNQAEEEEASQDGQEENLDTGCFWKLSDVLTDDNLLDVLNVETTLLYYEYPVPKGKVPKPIDYLSDEYLSFQKQISHLKETKAVSNWITLPCYCDRMIQYDGRRYRKWDLIEKLLNREFESLYELEKAIGSYNPYMRNVEFDILRGYINYELAEEEQDYFFETLLPNIIRVALELPRHFHFELPVLPQNSPSLSLFLSQVEISSLLANAFLCTYDSRSRNDAQCINFHRLYSSRDNRKRSAKREKIKCLLNYFRKVTTTEPPVGTVSFTRRCLRATLDLAHSQCPVSQFELNSGRCLFEDNPGFAMVDFANKTIGGGVLGAGSVQEEILFVLCPELIVSKMFTEPLLDRESMLITGAEKYNCYSGYAEAFQWKSRFNDTTLRDRYGRRMRQIIVMDALYFSAQDKLKQYSKVNIDREILKALGAFQAESHLASATRLPAIATGNWGCGVYNGDPHLKTLIQLVAASECARAITFYTFNRATLAADFEKIKELIEERQATTGQLYQATLNFAAVKQNNPEADLCQYLTKHLLT